MHTESTARISSDIAVIGGGAAGMMAAVCAARLGRKVVLIEKNEKLGKKLYITGKGRCNFTNDCDAEEFLKHVPRNGRFLFSALHHFSPEDMKRFLEEMNCPIKIERGRRGFPASDKSSDVIKAFRNALENAKVQVLLQKCIVKIEMDQEKTEFRLFCSDGDLIVANKMILATGGLSYPSTGSTGDGYRFAQDHGHQVLPCTPSLTGIQTAESWPQHLQGISLKNVSLTLKSNSKKLFSAQGEMLFTHYGISGPLVLEASSILSGGVFSGKELFIDMKPAVLLEKLDADLCRRFQSSGRKQIASVLAEMLPHRMADVFLRDICRIDDSLPCTQINAKQRRTIAETLKNIHLTPVSLRDFDEAIITRGGVSVKEINPATMESKLTPGLYFAGEIMDVDAFTGGYNLQIAFSTGALAGFSAAQQ